MAEPTWYRVFESETAALEQLPTGRAMAVRIGSLTLSLAHTRSGFYAIEDTCPHLGDALHRGTLNYLDEIVCPWHSYRYSLQTGEECRQRTRNARVFPVRVGPDGLWVGV